jgi:hypothetical protein
MIDFSAICYLFLLKFSYLKAFDEMQANNDTVLYILMQYLTLIFDFL